MAKLAPNKPTKPIDYNDNLGIRFDKYGNCVPHSILGTVEEYLQEAVRNGQPIVRYLKIGFLIELKSIK